MRKIGGEISCILLLVVCSLVSTSAIAEAATFYFDIPKADAGTGLNVFAQQASTPLLFLNEDVHNRKTNRVTGQYTFERALTLLLEGTGIVGSVNENGVLTISASDDNKNEEAGDMVTKTNYLKELSMVASSLLIAGQATPVHAQSSGVNALEEIIVTAQRREETLQEVPVSLEVFSGAEIDLQGYRNLDDMSRYSPSVNMENGIQTQEVTIRGFGTAGNSLLLMSATPIFVDGIHFGRPSMIKNAFMDTERVEVLKGPQPLYFGMDATAGAFNIQTRRPSAEWEGTLSAEYGNNNRSEISGGLGGPVTDTLGIRVFGALEKIDGFAKDRVDQHKLSGYNNIGGRIVTEWTPNEKLNVFAKLDYSRQRSGGELYMGCLTPGIVSGYSDGRRGPVASPDTDDAFIGINGGGEAVWAPVSEGGLPFDDPLVRPERVTSKGQDCFQGEYGFSREGPYLPPPLNITGEGVRNLTDGTIDHRALADAFVSRDGAAGGPGRDGTNTDGIRGKDRLESWNALLEMNYTLDNGINLNSQTAYVRYDRFNVRDQSFDPFFSNFQGRGEDLYQISQQLRVDSRLEGYDLKVGNIDTNVEFMFGGFYQMQDLAAYASLFKDATGQGYRLNDMWEDPQWSAAFWNMKFNFMDKQLSLSVGGRYGHVKTQAFLRSSGAELIWDTVPCDSAGTDDNPATCAIDPNFKRVHPELTTYTVIDPETGRGNAAANKHVRVDSPLIVLDNVDMNNLWTASLYNDNNTKAVPLNWRGPFNGPVGITAPVYTAVNGPYGKCDTCKGDLYQSVSNYDSQFVLSYTPASLDGNHTFYGKYVTAFKGPIFDGSLGNIAPTVEEVTFLPEYVKAWELGAKGMIMEGRLRYDMAVFTNTYTDLQTIVAAPISADNASNALNAGKQKVDGGEFTFVYALSDNWTLNLAGAVMDGEMDDFDGGGCSSGELIAAAIDATTNPSGRSAEELDTANDILDSLGATRRAALPSRSELPEEFFMNGGCRLEDEEVDGGVRPAETIDRSGVEPARTPNYKLVVGADYTRPVMNDYRFSFGIKGFYQGEMLTDGETYTRHVTYQPGGDISLFASIGPQDGRWVITGYARNLLEYTKTYDPYYDIEHAGITVVQVQASSFTAYGLKLDYNFW